jgi:hypothetical protein
LLTLTYNSHLLRFALKLLNLPLLLAVTPIHLIDRALGVVDHR